MLLVHPLHKSSGCKPNKKFDPNLRNRAYRLAQTTTGTIEVPGFSKTSMASELQLSVRRLSTLLKHCFPSPSLSPCSFLVRSRSLLIQSSRAINHHLSSHSPPLSRTFYSSPLLNLNSTETEGPAAIDYRQVFRCKSG